MTAIVAVLNKHAVAIAADSAVTMGDTHKVVNCGNKIFTLSKYHPISIMTYGNASFMGVPWDIIIKEYRKQLGDKSFPHVDDYMNDFINYLGTKNYFCDETTKHFYLQIIIQNFYDKSLNRTRLNNDNKDINDYSLVDLELLKCISDNLKAPRCSLFESYTQKDFFEYADSDFENFYKKEKLINIPDDKKETFKEAFFNYFIIQLCTCINTGLVFVGYGDEDIYPSLIPINVSIAIDNRLKYFISKNDVAIISDQGANAIISPFAQTDVIQTIVRGMYPDFQVIISNIIQLSIESYTTKLAEAIKSKFNINIEDTISTFDTSKVSELMIKGINNEMKDSYTDLLLNTIISLDKEDLANMAESFISLTSLVRRMSPHEETVGGPVDVAVISKGDGFIWINRKHYFKPELNNQFFENYYK